ncbi:ABC transporter ATP-binding protein [Paenibacillus sp. YYML68]|uniref:ABC transporter ATP-binding protein n=1 Tax=Paenibacillus sp. YYML68 TaxID=2909250 RepID=UPI00248FA39E|nr:ABC transporter ATP-binding protein [Paenibacillus sp. YYML68]
MIEVQSVTYTYPRQAEPALRDISFDIRRGEIFGFLGPSGAGKSTTQKLLIGLLKGYQGSAQVLGREVSEWGPDDYERIGVAYEFPYFYERYTAKENLNWFGSLYRKPSESPEQLLARFGLEEAANRKVGQFSKGMKMRLNVCRAMQHEPELLFLDEPTSGLDPVSAQQMKEQIVACKAKGQTVILTTHNMAAAEQLCDRVAFVTDGRIRLIDTPRQLKLKYGARRVTVEHRERGGVLVAEHFELDGLGDHERFLALLRTGQVETLHSQETTLERIFIEVTGRGLQ